MVYGYYGIWFKYLQRLAHRSLFKPLTTTLFILQPQTSSILVLLITKDSGTNSPSCALEINKHGLKSMVREKRSANSRTSDDC